LLQAAPFLAAATIIIYAGAIVVTFLFVIMLAQQAGFSSADQRSREPFLASVAGFVLLGALLCVLKQTYEAPGLDDLVSRADRASRAPTLGGVDRALGGHEQFEKEWLELLQGRKGSREYVEEKRLKGDKARIAERVKGLVVHVHDKDLKALKA